MLILEYSQGCYGRMDDSVTISLHNFVGEGIINVPFVFYVFFHTFIISFIDICKILLLILKWRTNNNITILLVCIHARFQHAPVTSTINNYYQANIIHTPKFLQNLHQFSGKYFFLILVVDFILKIVSWTYW